MPPSVFRTNNNRGRHVCFRWNWPLICRVVLRYDITRKCVCTLGPLIRKCRGSTPWNDDVQLQCSADILSSRGLTESIGCIAIHLCQAEQSTYHLSDKLPLRFRHFVSSANFLSKVFKLVSQTWFAVFPGLNFYRVCAVNSSSSSKAEARECTANSNKRLLLTLTSWTFC